MNRPAFKPISRNIGATDMPSFAASSARTKSTEIGAALDQLYAEGVAHGRCFRHGNLFYNVARESEGSEPLVRMVQWPSYHQPVLERVRLDTRFADLLEPLIGRDLKQIINQVHWKAPGSLGDFAWHQDSRSRRPASAYRNLATSYVQTGLAIDPHTPESGCMRFIPRSHLRGDLRHGLLDEGAGHGDDRRRAGRGRACRDADAVDLLLEPGDLALWSPYLVHGSGKNASTHKRRFYINGYVRAADCDRGEWAFRDGRAGAVRAGSPRWCTTRSSTNGPDPHYSRTE